MVSALGNLIAWLGCLMVVPAFVDWYNLNDDWQGFATASAISIFFGLAVFFAFRQKHGDWTSRNVILFVNALWVGICLFAALPLYFSNLHLSFTDAFFESVSGLTTTGSTVLSGLDDMAPGILLWRSMMQWIGGLGIVVIGLSILPSLGAGGQKLFYLESSDHSDKPFPRVREFALRIVAIYLVLTLLCSVAYYVLGMNGFEAINHSMTTVSTGGFSTSDESIWHFHSMAILLVASLFMFIGGLPFVYLISLFSKQGLKGRVRDPQIAHYFWGVLLASAGIFLAKDLLVGEMVASDFALSLFNVISVVTTTGYAAGDYQLWGPVFGGLFLLLTFLGACSGSTSGGIKQFRFLLVWQVMKQSVVKMVRPHQISSLRYGKRVVGDAIAASVMGFLFIFFGTFALFAVLLEMSGLDFTTSLSASATALANVGPGIGEVIGPAGNFASLPAIDKWLLSWEMILGRLEILSGYALLLPSFWRW